MSVHALALLLGGMAVAQPVEVPSKLWTCDSAVIPHPFGTYDVYFTTDGRSAVTIDRQEAISIWRLIVHSWPAWLALPIVGLLIMLSAKAVRAVRHPEPAGEPMCRRCGYQLTGGRGEACPECGAVLHRRAVRTGRSGRQRLLPWAGILTGLIAAYSLLLVFGGWVEPVSGWFDWPSRVLARVAQRYPMDWVGPVWSEYVTARRYELGGASTGGNVIFEGSSRILSSAYWERNYPDFHPLNGPAFLMLEIGWFVSAQPDQPYFAIRNDAAGGHVTVHRRVGHELITTLDFERPLYTMLVDRMGRWLLIVEMPVHNAPQRVWRMTVADRRVIDSVEMPPNVYVKFARVARETGAVVLHCEGHGGHALMRCDPP